MASPRIEQQRMGMRRGLQLRMRSAAGVLKNTAHLSQASVLCNRNQVVNSPTIRRHCKQLSTRGDSHVPRPGRRQRKRCPAQQRHTPILGTDMERLDCSARQSLVLIDFIGDVQRLLRRREQHAGGRLARYPLYLRPKLALQAKHTKRIIAATHIGELCRAHCRGKSIDRHHTRGAAQKFSPCPAVAWVKHGSTSCGERCCLGHSAVSLVAGMDTDLPCRSKAAAKRHTRAYRHRDS